MKARTKGGQALREYMRCAMAGAVYRRLDDGTAFGEIPGFDGVYASALTMGETQRLLEEVLEGWLLLSLERGLPVPSIEGVELPVRNHVV